MTAQALTAPALLSPTRQAVFDRISAAARAMVAQASESDILATIAAPTGTLALAHLITVLPAPDAAADEGLASAYAGAAQWRTDYLAAVPTLSASDAQAALGLRSTEALRKRDRAGTILALPLASGKFAYPAWQFVDGRVVGGLAGVREALGTDSAWAFAGQLETIRASDEAEPRTLRSMLVVGDVTAALQAASAAADSGGA